MDQKFRQKRASKFQEKQASEFRQKLGSKIWRSQITIHVVVENSSFDPCSRQKIQVSIHVFVEIPKVDPCCRRSFDEVRHNRQ